MGMQVAGTPNVAFQLQRVTVNGLDPFAGSTDFPQLASIARSDLYAQRGCDRPGGTYENVTGAVMNQR